MRKTYRRARRGPSFGWQIAHARLEDRLLLSGTPAETMSFAIVSRAHFDSATSPDQGVAVGAAGASDSGGSAGPAASSGGWHGGVVILSDPAHFSPGTSPMAQAIGDVRGGDPSTSPGLVVSPGIGATSPGPGLGPYSTFVGMLEAGRGFGPADPPMIGDQVGPRLAGIEGTILQRMEDHFPSYQPAPSMPLGLLHIDPALPLASMASIVGSVEADVVVLAPAASPAIAMGSATSPPVLVKADDVPTEAPASLGGFAGTSAVAAPVAAPALARDTAADPGAEDSATAASSGEDSEPGELPAPIGLGLRLAAPFLDATGWDEALGQLVEGVDDLLGGLEDLGGEGGYLPWIVAAGAAVTATEVAPRARARPGFAAAFVGGSVEAVDPADVPRERTRGAMLSDSVRRLLARGMSRWTTRR